MIPPAMLDLLRTKDPRFSSKPQSIEQMSPVHKTSNFLKLPSMIDFKNLEPNDFNSKKRMTESSKSHEYDLFNSNRP
jgi:hypothetical protein